MKRVVKQCNVSSKKAKLQNTKNIFDVSFMKQMQTDVEITNRSTSFKAHKAILCALSSTIQDIFCGDASAKEIFLEISDATLIWLYEFIYASRECRSTMDLCSLQEIMVLIKKYDMQFLHFHLLETLETKYKPGNFQADLQTAEEFGFDMIASKIRVGVLRHIESMGDEVLKTMDFETMKLFMKKQTFVTDVGNEAKLAACIRWINAGDDEDREKFWEMLYDKVDSNLRTRFKKESEQFQPHHVRYNDFTPAFRHYGSEIGKEVFVRNLLKALCKRTTSSE